MIYEVKMKTQGIHCSYSLGPEVSIQSFFFSLPFLSYVCFTYIAFLLVLSEMNREKFIYSIFPEVESMFQVFGNRNGLETVVELDPGGY